MNAQQVTGKTPIGPRQHPLIVTLVLGALLSAANAGTPPEPPIRAPAPHDILKNRFISIDPRGAGQTNPSSHHIRVTVDSSEVNGHAGFGPWWANAPFNTINASCISLVTTTKPAVEPDWTGCDTAHLTGCPIIPTTTYIIQTEVDGELSSGNMLATQARPGIKWFGDITGGFNGTEWSGPNGVVNVNDLYAALFSFADATGSKAAGCANPPCTTPHVSVTDISPVLNGDAPNQAVNANELFVIVLAFQGKEYPGPDLMECP